MNAELTAREQAAWHGPLDVPTQAYQPPRRTRFSLLHYFALSFNDTLGQFAVWTPLFALSLEIMVSDLWTKTRFTGVRVSFLPVSWKFMLEEGQSMYRYNWRLGFTTHRK